VVAGSGVKVDPATQTVSVDPAQVPVLPQCAANQVIVKGSATNWTCASAAPDSQMLGGQPPTTYATASSVSALQSAVNAALAALVPPGTIVAYAGTVAPPGWLLCDGSSLVRTDFAGLFAAIGTAHGTADASHFNLPDYRGRFLRGVDSGAGNDPDRASRGPMLPGGNAGDAVGSLQANALGSHQHSTVPPGNPTGAGVVFFAAPTGGNVALATGTVRASILTATQSFGGNETRPVNINVNWIIKI
jgi:microcystin-dependent protein